LSKVYARIFFSRARVVKSVDTADLKSADSKKSCRFDSGLGHHQFSLFLIKILRKIYSILFLLLSGSVTPVLGQSIFFDCKRSEKDYVEEYAMQLTLASKTQKAKMYLDERDLDQSDAYGTQVVKSVTLARPNIFIVVEASFAPEEIMGVAYPAGSVSTHITLDPVTGKLKKVEKIQGGILGASLGNGTHVSEETCFPAKIPFKP
jgi:hypothetical protein